MMKKVLPFVQTLLSIVIIINLLLLFVLELMSFIDVFPQNIALKSTIIIGLATVLTALANVYISKKQDQISARKALLREKKVPVYEKILGLIFNSVRASVEGKQPEEDEIREDMLQIMQNLNLWAPNEVVHAFVKFRKVGDNSDSKKSPSSVLDPVADLVLAIRKDLGYKTKGMDRAFCKTSQSTLKNTSEVLQSNISTKTLMFCKSLDRKTILGTFVSNLDEYSR